MMCHSNATAEKFYEADLDFNEAFETRKDTAFAIAECCNQSGHGQQTDNDVDIDPSNRSSEEEEQGDKDNEQALKRTGKRTGKRAGVQQDSEMRRKKGQKKRSGSGKKAAHQEGVSPVREESQRRLKVTRKVLESQKWPVTKTREKTFQLTSVILRMTQDQQ